jgi:putative peptidoglycan lipid II flippase
MALARNIATMGGATLLSRVLGFARDAGIAALFGSSPFAQAFFAVLQLINFFRRLLAEGAVNGAFAPIWLRLKHKSGASAANRFTRRVLFTTGLVTVAAAIVGFLLAPLIVHVIAPGFNSTVAQLAYVYVILAVPYVTLAGVVAVIAAALNAEGKVGAVAFATVAFNLVLLAVVAVAFARLKGDLALAGAWLAAAIVAAGFLQLVIVAVAWTWKGKRLAVTPRGSRKDVRQFFRRAALSLISAGIPQLKLLAGAAVASSSVAGVSWLYYASRLYELPLGVASVAIASVIVPRIAASVRCGNKRDIAAAQSRAYEIALGLALPAAAAFAVLATPIAGGLFQRGAFGPNDTAAVAAALAAICAGLPGHVLEKLFGAVSFAHEDARTPMLAALCGLAAAIGGAVLLFPYYGHVGVAAAIAISGWVGAGIMAAVLVRRRWLRLDAGAAHRLPRIVAATAAMAAALATGQALAALTGGAASAAGRSAVLAALVALGLAVYFAAVQLMGVAQLSQLRALLRGKI